jgi:hypothetical protein
MENSMQHYKPNDELGDADYVAIANAIDVHPDGSVSRQARWLLDCVPTSVLDRIGVDPEMMMRKNDEPALDFFLLTLQQNPYVMAQDAELNGYIHVTVSQKNHGGDNEIRAFATGLNGIDNNNIEYFVRIRRIPPKREHIKTLKQLARFSHIDDAESLAAFEPRSYKDLAVAVYDVGQGSMSALVDRYEHPVMFFDLGWPLSFNSKSIPATQSDFNPFPPVFEKMQRPTPVVLSHLDWDHWAYVLQGGRAEWDGKIGAWKTVPEYRTEALKRPWLMRRPDHRRHKLGGSHIHFIQTLGDTNVNGVRALHFWRKGERRKSLGPITLFICSRKAKSPNTTAFLRNNQGLGMLVRDVQSGARVLLTGDADFVSIPAFAKKRLTGLVAPHHGGKITVGSVPEATGHGRMVMSAYPGCYSNIPHPDVEHE